MSADSRQKYIGRPPLVDSHAHSEFAYCGRGVSAQAVIDRTRQCGLAGVCIVEHAPQLYCQSEDFWEARHVRNPQLWHEEKYSRMAEFRRVMAPLKSDFVHVGLEVELDCRGELTIKPEDRTFCDLVVGAVHFLSRPTPQMTDAELADEFMRTCRGLIAGGIDILAHPWRFFMSARRPVPTELYPDLVEMLAAAKVAAEINLHRYPSDWTFFAQCARRGVKISLATDAHEMHEVGRLEAHLAIVKQAVGSDDPAKLQQALWYPKRF
ncbi:MAG: hypothetical protein HZA50_02100 [Planctomycetes bacterium]|nr:hypothetical protein [Planctomycetota bacterium]